MWIDMSELKQDTELESRKRERPCVHSDVVIQMLLWLKQVFRLPLRILQGFVSSLRKLAFANLPVPNFTTLSRRAQDLNVVIRELRPGEALSGTGPKVFGEGEWKARIHSHSKRCTWRKVHLTMDAQTSQICAAAMPLQPVADTGVLPEQLEQTLGDMPIDTIGGDGAYDSRQCHPAVATRDAQPSIPPSEGAMLWPEGAPSAPWRNEVIEDVARSGRREWKKSSDYPRHSLVENSMCRLKTPIGNRLWARAAGSQATKVSIREVVLKRMAALAFSPSASHEFKTTSVALTFKLDLCSNNAVRWAIY